MLGAIYQSIKENGMPLTAFDYFRKVLNFTYRKFIICNSKLHVDYTAKLDGIKNVRIDGKVFAGRHFWLATYEHYGKQRFNPQIVFKGIFCASDFCHIGATNYIEIGNNVLFGSKVYVTDHGHGIYSGNEVHSRPTESPFWRKLNDNKKVIIGDNVWIGDNVVILPGVTIGSGCIIGSNAVVTKDIPDNCIAVGIPAKVIKRFDFVTAKWIDDCC